MPQPTDRLDLDVDLLGGVVPISKAASALAALIKRSREQRQIIIVTQKGYPSGVLLSVELFTALRERAERALGAGADGAAASPQAAEPGPAPEPGEAEAVEPEPEPVAAPEAPPPNRARGARRPKAQQAESA